MMIIGCSATIAFAEVEPTQLTLTGAVDLAMQRSPKIRSMHALLDEALAKRGVARSQYLPKVGIAGGFEKNPAYATDATRLAYGYASWNLFNGFSDRRNAQLAELNVARAEIDLEEAKFALMLDVESRFYGVLGAAKSFAEWQQALAVTDAALKDVRQRRGAGMMSAGDVVAFEVRQARVSSEAADAQAEVELAKAEFYRLIGYDLSQKITFSGDVPRYALNEKIDVTLKSAHEKAIALRKFAIESAKSDVVASQWVSGVLPKIDLEARHGMIPVGERPPRTGEADVSATAFLLTAKLELFSGFATLHDRRVALAQKVQSEEDAREASLDLLSRIEKHLRRMVALEKRLSVEGENSLKTSKFKDTTAREYRMGVKSAQDYAAAVDLVIDVRRRYVDSLLAWHAERILLEKSLGRRLNVKEVK